MLRPSFVPPEPIRLLRDLTRYRVDLVGERGREKNRVEKLLEDAQIKLSVVASDIFGVSGRAMMAALIAGERDPQTLAQLARSRMRTKLRELREAFEGRFSEHHAFLLSRMLDRIDATNADITTIEERIEELTAPFAAAVTRLDEIPGVGLTAARAIIAEIGLDMTRFPTAGHLASWAKFAPGVNESAGKTKGNGATGHGNPYLARVLGEAAVGTARTNTFLGEHLPRRTLPPHRPTSGQEESRRRRRTIHPHHRLAPPARRTNDLHRPRPRLLRHPRRHPTHHPQPHPRPPQPRLPRSPSNPRHDTTTIIPVPLRSAGSCRLPPHGSFSD
jgi:hypothetical protein